MPADADTWSESRLRVVLLHELAHVKRRDCLTHVLGQAACAFHWFNPLAWLAVKRARTERERACDDLVLACGTRGSDYADQLLEMARVLRGDRFPALLGGASLAMAHRSQLEGRLMAILDPAGAPLGDDARPRSRRGGARVARRSRRSARCSRGRRTPRCDHGRRPSRQPASPAAARASDAIRPQRRCAAAAAPARTADRANAGADAGRDEQEREAETDGTMRNAEPHADAGTVQPLA